jgi:GDP-4-dehydro-6-deoxy-D-mannose reductase
MVALKVAGHEAIAAPASRDLDIADARAVRDLIGRTNPDGVVHLAAIAYAPDAAADAAEAMRINIGGTIAVVEASLQAARPPALVVAGSSEVYAPPEEGQYLTETSHLGPRNAYALTKSATEAIAVQAAARGLRVAVARSFNHTGPGQREDFAVPAFARRILEARRHDRHSIRVGNVDVWRDIGDVRDTVRAYVLLLELLTSGSAMPTPPIFNVSTGRPTHLRSLILQLAAAVRWQVELATDPALVRGDDPRWIAGDASRLRLATGWEPEVPMSTTLADLIAAISLDSSTEGTSQLAGS